MYVVYQVFVSYYFFTIKTVYHVARVILLAMNTITIFTDGSSRGNPGPGGWGAIVAGEKSVVELGGRESKTTNNRMEMQAIIAALQCAGDADVAITIFTDSKYVINGATAWIHGWKKNGWKTKNGDDVQNKDLWEQLDAALQGKKVAWHAVSGHAGIPGNERVDEIATQFADEKSITLFDGLPADYQIDLTITEGDVSAKAKKQRSNAKAFSYLSLVNGELRRHATWTECEARVSGQVGVKYRKAVSEDDERAIMEEWGVSA